MKFLLLLLIRESTGALDAQIDILAAGAEETNGFTC